MYFSYKLSDGQEREEEGSLKSLGDAQFIVVKGQFTFVADDGVTYTIKYVADENGFRPDGDHIPKKADDDDLPAPEVILVPQAPSVSLPANVIASLIG